MKKIAFVSLFLTFASFTNDEDFISKVSFRLEQYAKINPDENLCILLNKEKFAVNDTIFFSAYYYQADLKPIETKRIFGLGLFTSTGAIISRINFSVLNGHSYNQIYIPAKTNPGVITLAAFDTETGKIFFSRPVSIVSRKSLQLIQNIMPQTVFGFEGGAFTLNAKNHLVVFTNPNSPVAVKVDGRELARSVADSTGLSSFDIKPKNGEQYSLNVNGSDIQVPYPVESGCGLHVSTVEHQKKVEISLPYDLQKNNEPAFLLLAHNQKVIATSLVSPNANGLFTYFIEDRDLPNGITEIVVITEKKVLAQRMLYHFRAKANVQLKLTTETVKPRSFMPVSLVIRDNTGNPLQGTYTVTASILSSMEGYHRIAIEDDFFVNPLIAEFAHQLPKNPVAKQACINQLLALKENCRTPWEEIITNRFERKRVAQNLVFKAHFENAQGQIPDSVLFNCFLQNSMLGYEARTRKGHIQVPFLYDFWGQEEMFYSLENRSKEISKDFRLVPDTLRMSHKSSISAIETTSEDSYGDLEFKIRLVAESYGFFAAKTSHVSESVNLNERFEDEAMGTDFSVNVEDYVVFPTMYDLIKEVIPFLEVRNRKGVPRVRLLVNQKNHFSRPKFSPLFVIDGSLTLNQNLFLNLKPVDIFRIKLINDANKLTQFGSLGLNGIVLVETKKKQSDKLVDQGNLVKIWGLNKGVEKKNNWEKKNRVPDLRTNLIWQPITETSTNGESNFQVEVSDLTDDVILTIRGKTKTGIPFESSQIIKISKD